MKGHLIGILVLLVTAVGLGTAVTQPLGAQAPVYGGHFRRQLPSDPANLDPAQTNTVRAISVKMNLFDSLLRLDPRTFEMQPGAAETWSLGSDGRTITFRLRRNIRFHHGREMTAEDVRYTIERILAPETASPFFRSFDRIVGAQEYAARQARDVSGIRVTDRYTISITNSVADATFPLNFTNLAFFIVPRDEVERLGREFGRRPVGSGPFVFVSWHPDDTILLRENPDYWEGRPYISALEFRIIPDPATAQAEFDTGRLDYMLLSDVTYRRYADDPAWKPYVIEVPELFTRHIGLNVTKPPLGDVRIRQAINHAIDKTTMVRTVLQGKALVATGVFPPSHAAYNKDLKGYDYNPGRARELLTQAGLAAGFDLELHGSTSPVIGRWLEGFQRYLADVGIRGRIVQQDFGVMLDRAGRNEIPTWVLSHGGGPNCVSYLGPFRSRNFGPAGNRMRYKNDRVDALLDEAERTFNPRQQVRLCQEAERLIVADAPWFFFNYNKAALVHQPHIRGLIGNPVEMDYQPMHRVWIAPGR
ncbi:MAG: ABC transporter substrate-binding protein [Armatimonadota bacterium]|nr:ABC transporter substrate-binding protein [Armatimonadota bacterium]